MTIQMTLTGRFDAPPDAVFEVLTDIDGYGDWMPNFVRVERLSEGEFGVGTRFRETRRMFGRESTEEFEVTAFEPGRLLELYIDGKKGTSGSGEYRFRYTFEPRDGGTDMTMHGEIGGLSGFARLLGKLFAGGMRKAIAKDHAALRAHVSRRAAA